MIDGKFDVIFRGQIVKSLDLETVKKNLVKLFKSSPQAVERLFSGSEVSIRKDLDYASAMKYQSALKSAGALALIKEVKENSAEPEVKTPPPVSQTTTTASDEKDKAVSTEKQVDDKPDNDIQQAMSIAAAGAQILPPKVYEQRDVDTSELSLASAGERILPEKEPEKHTQPSIDHLSLE